MSHQTYTLPNGLRIIQAPSPTGVAYCGYAVDAGTRDERDNEQGMAHFVEHLIFKGTRKRKAWHILNRMERVGGDLNAYTNKEETVVYSTFLKEHFLRAAELLTDIVFNSTFPQAEIEKEVEVIIDEIQSYEDSPSELIFDDFEELIFPDHPLGRNILGRPDLLRDFDYRRMPPLAYQPKHLTLYKDTHQSHVMIGSRGYDAYDEHRTGLYLLNNILGGPGMNSRLNVSLRERRGLVYNVEANLTSYTDTGAFCIYFGCDPDDADACTELVYKELKKLRDRRLTSTQLAAAQKQIIGQIGVSTDNFENVALDMGKCFLHYGTYEHKAEVYQRINALTADYLLEIANEKFAEEQLSVLVYR